MNRVVRISSQGRITLPAPIYQELDLKPGDTVLITVEEGRIVLEPATTLPIELYTRKRMREFDRANQASEHELAAFRKAWDL